MTEPSSLRCPGCDATGLRAVGTRLVCDRCDGMSLARADLAESLRELDASTSEVEVVAGAAAGRPCVRCGGGLHAATVRFGKTELKPGILACATDDLLFVPQAALLDGLERVGRAGGARGAGGGPALPPRTGSAGAAAGGIRDAFGSHLVAHQGATRAAPRTPFTSAFAGQALVCPVDAKPLEAEDARWTCATCGGNFVEHAALAELVGEMTGGPWTPPEATGKTTATACPVCRAMMTDETIEGTHAGRCVHHGVWLAEAALAQLLAHATAPPAHRSWLGRLFGR